MNEAEQTDQRPCVLVVDDEADLRALIDITLARMGFDTRGAADLEQARRLLRSHEFALCLTDMRLPDGRGMELVQQIQRDCPSLPVAVITAYGNMELAVEALRAGAFDCISKPVDLDGLRNLVRQAVALAPAQRAETGLIGESAVMNRLRASIDKVARSQAPVCISGESGTGKEVIAREIHARGSRADKPFIPVNCGAIPAELIESEFFGHLKGSFTGASCSRDGFFQAAEGGTLFLDEIGDMPLPMQVKLLRALQERHIRPLGAQQEQPVDVRVLSASHKSLSAEVEAGRFREDLYYRINVIDLYVPPLRERREDIPLLADALLTRVAAHYGRPFRLTDAAITRLLEYDYPGNVRELENILERAAALCDGGEISADELFFGGALRRPASRTPAPPDAPSPAASPLHPPATSVRLDERQALVDALEAHRWNRTATARALGMTLRQLRYRMKKYRIG